MKDLTVSATSTVGCADVRVVSMKAEERRARSCILESKVVGVFGILVWVESCSGGDSLVRLC
jgi:hypothetical protein